MGSRKTHAGVEKVYDAAELWVDRALRSDDSLFTPGTAIWSSRWLGELHRRFLNQPDESDASFIDKLRGQLAGSPAETYQLMGEVLYFYFLIVYARNSANERRVIDDVLRLSPSPVEIPMELVTALTPGVANPGQYFHTGRPFQVGFLIEFVEQWKELESEERSRLLDDPWAFKNFAMRVDLRSELLRGHRDRPRIQREAVLHLVHPDTFEGTVSIEHKNGMASSRAFAHHITQPTEDVDRKIQQIRHGLKIELGRDFDFYDDDIQNKWRDPAPDPWDEFVRRAKEYVDTGKLESEEIEYKLEIGRKLAAARDAVFDGDDDWADLVKSGVLGNLIFRVILARFRDWVDDSPHDVIRALEALWTRDNSAVVDRIDGFCHIFPKSVISGAGTRMNVVSVLLMGLDALEYPPFRVTLFEKAYELTGYGKPEQNAGEAALYEHALGFLDRFIEEAAERGLTLRHRLDAQSVIWGMSPDDTIDPPPPTEPPGLKALSAEVFLPVEFLQEIETLLKEKKQVIFQGPPGTGKTYVARKLAACLGKSDERVTLVQFHPSYAYEGFIQGFRPKTTDGQAGFELRNGPLLQAAERARKEPDANHYLVIDEINRGNVAKVFGELYFLLEYRDSEMNLQYSDEPFSLPGNLYIIGTMNTADRSIALVDMALRRRFYFKMFHPDDEPVKSVLRKWIAQNATGMEWVADVVERTNELLKDDRHAAIGPSYFMTPGLNEAAVRRIWEHSVLPYLEERRFGGDEVAEEFDLDKLRRTGGPASAQEDGEAQEESASGDKADGVSNASA